MKPWKKRISLMVLAAMVLISLTGCTDEIDSTGMNIPEPDEEILDAFDATLANASNEFGLEL